MGADGVLATNAAKNTQLKRHRLTQPTNFIGGQVPPTLLGTQRANNVGDTALLPLRSKSCLWRRSENHIAKATLDHAAHATKSTRPKATQRNRGDRCLPVILSFLLVGRRETTHPKRRPLVACTLE